MKTTCLIRGNLTRCVVALAVAGLMALPYVVSAQESGSAKGGAGKLTELKPINTVADAEAVQAGDMVVMSCPKCKNSWVTIVTPPTKTGAKAETHVEARHDCPGCEHKYVTEGHGKMKTDKIIHVCKQCGSEDAFCCVMKKGSGSTPGMEKK